MKKAFYIALVLLTTTPLLAQEQVEVRGVLLATNDSVPIPRAHVLNITAKRGVISNKQGQFTFIAEATDSILVSVLGYNTYLTTAAEMTDTIYMKERNYFLELYNVMPYKTFEEFKEAFVNLVLPDTFKHINPTIYLSKEAMVQAHNQAQMGIIIPVDFSALSKRAKDKTRTEELIEQERFDAFLATKFNPRLVKRITNLEDSETLNDFMEYCDYSKSYLALNDNYTIITETFECYQEYLSLQ